MNCSVRKANCDIHQRAVTDYPGEATVHPLAVALRLFADKIEKKRQGNSNEQHIQPICG
jgi:hypothetical protein